jgi:K+-transporting ATPase ATPase C chain
MIRETIHALAACLVTFALCAVAYPAAVWGLAQVAFPEQAEGSLIYARDRTVIGSSLVAQPFASAKYFHPRPSAVDYNASAAGGSNLGTKNPDLRKKIAERAEALKATPDAPAPVELVTASGGGLDPHITPEGARYQAARVAAARDLPIERVRELIEQHTERSAAILGAPARVNVLLLNRALDDEKPTPSSAVARTDDLAVPGPASAAGPTGGEPPPSSRPAAPAPDGPATAADPGPRSPGVEALAGRLDRLRAKFEAAPVDRMADELKEVKVRLTSLVQSSANPADLARKLEEAGGRIATIDRELEALRGEVKSLREANRGDETLAALDGKIGALRADLEALRRPAAGSPAPTSNGMEGARSLFKTGQYAVASDAFRALTESRPDDARSWYFAALARGLATRQWRGEPEQLVLRGVDRERAGTPTASEIDRAFSDLTADTGREWLAFYRKRAANP